MDVKKAYLRSNKSPTSHISLRDANQLRCDAGFRIFQPVSEANSAKKVTLRR
jgi:hypothetical protein